MSYTFFEEDHRKSGMFAILPPYLETVAQKFNYYDPVNCRFTEFYEGIVTINHVAYDCMEMTLDDGSRIKNFELPLGIYELFRPGDLIFLVMGFFDNRWWPVEVVSMASQLFDPTQSDLKKVHMTVNPLLMEYHIQDRDPDKKTNTPMH